MNLIDSHPTVHRQPFALRSAGSNGTGTAFDSLPVVLEALRHQGFAVVPGVLDADFLSETRERLYAVQSQICRDVGTDRLERAGELGVLRLMMKYDAHFLQFLEIPEMLAVIDATVSPTAILHLQNGFILPSFPRGTNPTVFQNQFHMDFPRVLEGYVASINVMFAIDAFTAENGGTIVVPGTQQRSPAPSQDYLKQAGVPVECPEGSMVIFDSTLWHAAGRNVSGSDRLAINHQFTRSWIKQQIDYVRALGDDVVQALPARTQQLLGWYTRVVTSLDEYYRPESERLYRRGQG
jgi:ectoine hydroxylase-related dioxygenase (phytanoyl-CoA dioxygenase family)